MLLGLAMFSAATQAAGFWRFGVALAVVWNSLAVALFGWAIGYRARRLEEPLSRYAGENADSRIARLAAEQLRRWESR